MTTSQTIRKVDQKKSLLAYFWLTSFPYAWMIWSISGISPLGQIKPPPRTANELLVLWGILAVVLLLLLFTGYQIWRRFQIERRANAFVLFLAVYISYYLVCCLVNDFVISDAEQGLNFYNDNVWAFPLNMMFAAVVGMIIGSLMLLPIYVIDRIGDAKADKYA